MLTVPGFPPLTTAVPVLALLVRGAGFPPLFTVPGLAPLLFTVPGLAPLVVVAWATAPGDGELKSILTTELRKGASPWLFAALLGAVP